MPAANVGTRWSGGKLYFHDKAGNDIAYWDAANLKLAFVSGAALDIESGGAIKIAGTAISSTAAELNALDGLTAAVAELNILDGVTSTAAELNILDGVTALAGELNLLDDAPADITFAAASAAANVCEVTITVKDSAGVAIDAPFMLDVWLSDAADGVGLTGTTASGTVTAKAASGAVVGTFTAKKALKVQTLATGVFILEITDTAKTGFYVCATNPVTGKADVSAQLVTGDYGA